MKYLCVCICVCGLWVVMKKKSEDQLCGSGVYIICVQNQALSQPLTPDLLGKAWDGESGEVRPSALKISACFLSSTSTFSSICPNKNSV